LHKTENKFTTFTGKFTEAINVYNSESKLGNEYLNLVIDKLHQTSSYNITAVGTSELITR